MQRTVRRTARACERCRQARRKCKPPYPCSQCVAAGAACEVRTKARPHRYKTAPTRRKSDADRLNATGTGEAVVLPESGGVRGLENDTCELLKRLVHDVLLERDGYELECILTEPPTCRIEASTDSEISLRGSCKSQQSFQLNSAQVWDLLTAFHKFMGWRDPNLVDIEELHATILPHLDHLYSLSPATVSVVARRQNFPLDSMGAVFAALTIGAMATGGFSQARYYFDISSELVKHFAGRPTLDLCLAYFLQHVFARCSGTSNYARSIMTQVTQVALDLGLHENSHSTRGLQLFLVVYLADQYCSLTHNTETTIKRSQLSLDTFAPLIEATPQLQTLVDLVMINGYIIDKTHRHSSLAENEVVELEAQIGNLCSRSTKPLRPGSSGFRSVYEPFARIHMLCARIRLRAPGLAKPSVWLPSLCICVHAAQNVLATYFQLYRPILLALALHNPQGVDQDINAEKLSKPIAHNVPVSWRQVKRIMTSVFVVILAYWNSELAHCEASRGVAIARTLLEFPRWRWGDKLDGAVKTLIDVSNLADFSIHKHIQSLLPGATVHFTRLLCEQRPSTTKSASYFPHPEWDQLFSMPGQLLSLSDPLRATGAFDSVTGTIEDQTIFGLWENIDIQEESGPWDIDPF